MKKRKKKKEKKEKGSKLSFEFASFEDNIPLFHRRYCTRTGTANVPLVPVDLYLLFS